MKHHYNHDNGQKVNKTETEDAPMVLTREKPMAKTGWEYLSDMIRATIVVNELCEIWDAYMLIKNDNFFRILTIKDKLNSDLKNITLTFDFDNKLIGEL